MRVSPATPLRTVDGSFGLNLDTNSGPGIRLSTKKDIEITTDVEMRTSSRDNSIDLPGKPLVSVVTPVYNGERYLSECIESVLGQTYTNWEYVIVNNCSTDRSLEIAQSYARKDSRIRIHNNDEFLGIIHNWNNALRQISGSSKYCKVIHADDWLFPECVRQMVLVAENNPTVSIVGAYGLFGLKVDLCGLPLPCNDTPAQDACRAPFPYSLIPGREICRAWFLKALWVTGTPTSLLIRSDLIRRDKAFYNESNLHADTEACFTILQDSDFGFIHQILTYTRQHDEAQTSFSERFNTYLPADIYILKQYGPHLLTALEYEECLRRMMNRYYRYLGANLLKFRGKDFWDYHRNGMNEIGYSINLVKLIAASYFVAIDHLLHPKETVNKIISTFLGR